MSARTLIGRRDLRGALFVGLLVGCSCCAGILIRTSSEAHGEVRRTTSTEHFQSGAARSEPILQEIAATLRRIDARLERIEKAALDAAAKPPAGGRQTP